MGKRKALSKRTRFEIFKRDGFRCIYCGATPVQSVLHADHVIPVAGGGSDDPANLATSCADCNLGKSAVPLERKKIQKGVALKEYEDHAEQIREYLRIQKEIEASRAEVVDSIAEHWQEVIGPMSQVMYDRLGVLLHEWPYDRPVEAMSITGRKLGRSGDEYDWLLARNQAKYFHGILRNWREAKS